MQRGSLRKPSAGWTGDSAPGSPAYPSRHPHFYPVRPRLGIPVLAGIFLTTGPPWKSKKHLLHGGISRDLSEICPGLGTEQVPGALCSAQPHATLCPARSACTLCAMRAHVTRALLHAGEVIRPRKDLLAAEGKIGLPRANPRGRLRSPS